MKVLELFGGIGACSKALKRLGINYEIVDYVEIDKYAVKSFNAMHGTSFEPQDICEWDKDIDVDLITHGSPCQDFSIAGRQAGGDKNSGTRSSLMYETIRIVEKLKPKYVVWENVKNLLSKKHIHNFNAYLETMEQLGYISYYDVLNAKDYGVPQNRERVFTISIRKDIDKGYIFPPKQELHIRLKDILEDEVEEKYYLSEKMLKGLTLHNEKHKEKGTGFIWKPKTEDDIANCLRANASLCPTDNTIKIVGNTKSGGQRSAILSPNGISNCLFATDYKQPKQILVNRKYGVFDSEKSKHQAGSVYDENGLAPTLDTMQGGWRQPCIEVKNIEDNECDTTGVVDERN